MPDPSGARHLARVRQLRRVEKPPLNHAPHPMQRTDSDRAGLASRLEFGRDGRQEGGPLRDDRKATAKMLSAKGLSTREIAEITGWSHTTIENDLRGKNLPKTGKNLPAPTVAEPTGPSVAEPIAPSLGRVFS